MMEKFTISVPASNAVLVVSFVGYYATRLPLKDQSQVTISLQPDIVGMEEVVIGYGTQRKRDVTGAVTSAPVADMLKAPVKSFDEALAGRVAGVQVNSNDGQPGAGFNITIRGQNSLTQDNSPLYVVDGFPLEGNVTDAINPSDIESIEILKDASASAIYGARGANGVILITTKSGKKGKPVIEYNGNIGIQQNLQTMKLMDPFEFVKYQNELNPSITARLYLDSLGKTLDSYKTIQGYDWQDELFRAGLIQQHNISLSGATDQTKYFFSGSIDNQDGVIINSGFRRVQGRMTITQDVSKRLRVYGNLSYANYNTDGVVPSTGTNSATDKLLYSTWGYRPVSGSGEDLMSELFDPDIDGSNDYRVNPIISSNNELRHAGTDNLIGNAYAEYKITPKLIFRTSGGFRSYLRRNDLFFNSLTYWGNPLSSGGVNGVNGSVIYTQMNSWVNENILTYKTRINKVHNINAVVGVTFQEDKYKQYVMAAIQVPTESLGINGLDEGVPTRINATSSYSTLESFLSRINYDYCRSIYSRYHLGLTGLRILRRESLELFPVRVLCMAFE